MAGLLGQNRNKIEVLEFLNSMDTESEQIPETWISAQRERALSELKAVAVDAVPIVINAANSLDGLNTIVTRSVIKYDHSAWSGTEESFKASSQLFKAGPVRKVFWP